MYKIDRRGGGVQKSFSKIIPLTRYLGQTQAIFQNAIYYVDKLDLNV